MLGRLQKEGGLVLRTLYLKDATKVVDVILDFINRETGSHFKADYSPKAKPTIGHHPQKTRAVSGFSQCRMGFAVDKHKKPGAADGKVPARLRINLGEPASAYRGTCVEIAAENADKNYLNPVFERFLAENGIDKF